MKKLIIVVIRFVVLVASTSSGTKLTPLPVSIVEPTLTGGSRLLEPEALSGLTGNQKKAWLDVWESRLTGRAGSDTASPCETCETKLRACAQLLRTKSVASLEVMVRCTEPRASSVTGLNLVENRKTKGHVSVLSCLKEESSRVAINMWECRPLHCREA